MNETAHEERLTVPKQTTPTWEMELLISAASTFALFQLLAQQQDFYLRIAVWINEEHLLAILSPLYIYSRVVLISLAGAFVVHLSARAYWVGLIGLHSIFPKGPDLSKFSYGPFQLKSMTENKPHIDSLVEKADNRATMVFGFGVGLALIMVLPIILMAMVLALAVVFSSKLGYAQANKIALLAIVAPVVIVTLLPTLIDQLLGKYIAPTSLLGRLLSKSFDMLNRVSFNTSGNTLTMYLFSGMKGMKSAAFISMSVGFIFSTLAVIGLPRIIRASEIPKTVMGIEASDYALQRMGNLEFANRAYIQAPVIKEPYVDLIVPIPARDIPSGHKLCIKAKNEKQRMACLRSTLKLTLDRKPLSTNWLEQPASPGKTLALRTLIDVSALPRGQHVLQLDYSENPSAPKQAWREIIHFWN